MDEEEAVSTSAADEANLVIGLTEKQCTAAGLEVSTMTESEMSQNRCSESMLVVLNRCVVSLETNRLLLLSARGALRCVRGLNFQRVGYACPILIGSPRMMATNLVN
jgi:hypothetical protein